MQAESVVTDFHKFTLTIGVLCLLAGMNEWISRQVWESVAVIVGLIGIRVI